jgi:hypothetical protein
MIVMAGGSREETHLGGYGDMGKKIGCGTGQDRMRTESRVVERRVDSADPAIESGL